MIIIGEISGTRRYRNVEGTETTATTSIPELNNADGGSHQVCAENAKNTQKDKCG
jgi:hypothetical protein